MGKPGVALADLIRDAAGIWLYTTSFLHDDALVGTIRRSIAEGRRCFVQVGLMGLNRFNSFLAPYGLEGTRMGLSRVSPADSCHPRVLLLDRQTHPGAFRDPLLLEGVSTIEIQQPQVLLWSGDARPVVTVPLSDVDVVNLETDLLKKRWATAVGVVAIGGENERVLATTGGLFHDPYTGPGGYHFQGIDANRTLASNVLRWLGAGRAQTEPEDIVKAFALIDKTERGIATYLTRVLRDKFQDTWWEDGIPVNARRACADRAELERNQLPKWSYMDIVDWKETVKQNWQLVEANWRRAGWSGNRTEGLKWFDTLNGIRKSVMHPTKRAFGGAIRPEDLDFLRRLKNQVDTLAVT